MDKKIPAGAGMGGKKECCFRWKPVLFSLPHAYAWHFWQASKENRWRFILGCLALRCGLPFYSCTLSASPKIFLLRQRRREGVGGANGR